MTDREGGACTPVRDRRAESTHWFDGQLDCICAKYSCCLPASVVATTSLAGETRPDHEAQTQSLAQHYNCDAKCVPKVATLGGCVVLRSAVCAVPGGHVVRGEFVEGFKNSA